VTYEYKVIPAPTKGKRGRGVKGAEARFANALEQVLIELGSEGWEYQRAETLPSTERSGLTGSATQWRHVLIFRRAMKTEDVAAQDPQLEEPVKQIEHTQVTQAEPEASSSDSETQEFDETDEEPEGREVTSDTASQFKSARDKVDMPEPPLQGSKLRKVMSPQPSKSNDSA
jgi:hypothetical protein